MSGADYFGDDFAINPYMTDQDPVDIEKAKLEHAEIKKSFEKAGIKVTLVDPPTDCQDGVYTANWALISGKKAIMANLPNKRKPEETYAEKILEKLGYEIVKVPENLHFSGQGDALPCGDYLFVGSHYRTSPEAHKLLAEETGLEVISLQTIPQLDENQDAVINPITGWQDSYFYDLDLALAVIDDRTIAWCPTAFMPSSQEKIRNLPINRIEVSLEEAMSGFACNLVSTGESVIMSDQAPKLKDELEKRGLTVYTPEITELAKGGGFIRCISLTL